MSNGPRADPARVRIWPGPAGGARPSHNGTVTSDLDRFLVEQERVYDRVLDELRSGRKTGHWIWFIFPQIAGLGRSAMSQRFAIASLAEARAYLAHPVLGARLHESIAAVVSVRGRSADEILGPLDALKLRSSLTLFRRAAPDDPIFREALEQLYGGSMDEATDLRLQRVGSDRWDG
jgi:uncharacterized protein (DUF1810 family)